MVRSLGRRLKAIDRTAAPVRQRPARPQSRRVPDRRHQPSHGKPRGGADGTSLRRFRAFAAVAVLGMMLLAAPARADTVTQWNQIATSAGVADGQGSSAVVQLAIVHAAVYDAVNAIDRRDEPYLVAPQRSAWYSQDAAAATAAYRVLVDSQPPLVQACASGWTSSPRRGLCYDTSLAAIPPGAAKDGGIVTGNAAADAMIAARPQRRPLRALPVQRRHAPRPVEAGAPRCSSTTRSPGSRTSSRSLLPARRSSAASPPIRSTSRRYAKGVRRGQVARRDQQ